jgi:ubiquitin-like modifier-activating enzyme ATG7
VLAPVNSMRDRTLDQQCTVTKPGLSFISSALASELLMNLLHHPLREGCPASEKKDQLEENALGKIPHHIRGTISDFNVSLYYGKAFDQCIACSEFVVRRYLEKGEGFLLEVINNPNYVHEVTNLKELLDQEVTFESIEVEDGEEIVVIK